MFLLHTNSHSILTSSLSIIQVVNEYDISNKDLNLSFDNASYANDELYE